MLRPFGLHTELDTYKYDLIEFRKLPRIDIEYFHAAEDNRYVRGRVMEMLAQRLPNSSVDAVVVEKPKTGPALREPEKFYPKMLGYLLGYAMKRFPRVIGEIVIITDTIPVNRKRRAVEKALKLTLAEMLPRGVPYRIMHHSSKAHYGLQVADYLNWSIYRKWEHSDTEQYDRIAHLIRSEFEIFRTGQRMYYEMWPLRLPEGEPLGFLSSEGDL